MTLDAHVVVDRGGFSVDVALSVPPGEVLALLGPNGAGKTTTLRALAGLLPLREGAVRLADQVLEDPAQGIRLQADARGIGVVFQDYLLFPRMSARDNVAFGLRARGADRASARARAGELLRGLGLEAAVDQRPGRLSGGQAQRVALARALAGSPALLLLDEPLAALDAGTRMSVRTDLRGHLREFGGSTVLVTHDPLDALVLADRLVVMEAGRSVQAGTPAEVARAPRTDYVARLVGLNLLRGVAAGPVVTLDGGGELTASRSYEGAVYVAVRPSSLSVWRRRPDGSPRNTWPARVRGLESRGEVVRLDLAGPPDLLADVTTPAVAELSLGPGVEVWCSVKATDLEVYPVDEPS